MSTVAQSRQAVGLGDGTDDEAKAGSDQGANRATGEIHRSHWAGARNGRLCAIASFYAFGEARSSAVSERFVGDGSLRLSLDPPMLMVW